MKEPNLNQIRIERTLHHEKAVFKLIFSLDVEITSLIKQIKDAKWSQTMHCWYIPNTPSSTSSYCCVERATCGYTRGPSFER
jgi:hypothetical protein